MKKSRNVYRYLQLYIGVEENLSYEKALNHGKIGN